MTDPFGGRSEISAAEWLAVVGRTEDALYAATMPQDATNDTNTRSKTLLDDFLAYGHYGRCEREARCLPGRRFRADWFLPDQEPPVIVEYDGLMRGKAHASIAGALRDSEKGNVAQAAGFRFYRCNAATIQDGTAFAFLDSVLRRVDE
jgi:hypothetical protein